jgi:thiol:disulfide interchange protein
VKLRFLLPLLAAGSLWSQSLNPAHWTLAPSAQKVRPGAAFTAELKLQLDPPWHMYSLTTPKPGPNGGPIATTIRLAETPAISKVRLLQPSPKRKFDPNFEIETETYEGNISFYFDIQLAPDAPPGPLELSAQLRYQLCTEKECLPPRKVTAAATVTVDPAAPPTAASLPAGLTEFGGAAPASAPSAPPVQSGAPEGLGSFLLVAFGFGLAAIFTPCVFPMIPITMSFFLNQGSATRGRALAQAVVFCLGIIGLFTGIGLAVTALLGPFGIVQLGSNVWVNAFICAVFFVFGISLLGAFEITLPSGLLTRLNNASSGAGFGPTLLMGLTFSLTAFACVGPFVGTLLAASVQGGKLLPVLGMMSFSAGLSAPFFFLALFPGYLQSLPRAGGWMARIKIVMGFLILAAMLKYFSNIDQVMQWNFLTRERFLAAWVVLFALPGLYLLGLLRMEGIKADERVGAGRLLAAGLLLAFSVSLLPGMFGTRLGEIEAYIPAPVENAASGLKWLKNQYEDALSQAKAENKLVLVNFTGYACTNCHWMKANMFPRPEVKEALKGLVLVELYTDGTDAVSEKNQQRQEEMFKSVAIPFYALLSPDGKVVASFAGLTKDPAQFVQFLKTRLSG